MKINNYYLPFRISSDVNYLFLFRLYQLAEYDINRKIFKYVRFSTLKELAENLGVSYDTLNRERKRTDNKYFFSLDSKGKVIELNSNFRGSAEPFIVLTDKEVSFLLEQNDNLLCKYLIYVKFYCSKRENSFTQEQFLSAIGYCSTSGKNKEKITQYNRILREYFFISVSTEFAPEEKKRRNSIRYLLE